MEQSTCAEIEIHCYLSQHFHRLSVQQRGPISPLQDRIAGGANQQGIAAQHLQIVHVPFPIDDCLKDNCALNPHDDCRLWVRWFHPMHQIGMINISTLADADRSVTPFGRNRRFRRLGSSRRSASKSFQELVRSDDIASKPSLRDLAWTSRTF